MEGLRAGLRRFGLSGDGAGAPVPTPGAGDAIVPTMPSRQLGPREEPVVGVVSLPLVLGLFSSGPAVGPYTRDQVQREFFRWPQLDRADPPSSTTSCPEAS